MVLDTLLPPAPAPVAGTAPATAKPKRFFRKCVATFSHPDASWVKGYVLIGAAWKHGAKTPSIYAERIFVLPMGDSFASHDAKEIVGQLADDVAPEFFTLGLRHGQPVDDYVAEMLDRVGLDVPAQEEPAGSFSSANLIAWSA
jgi:hypothetical protein